MGNDNELVKVKFPGGWVVVEMEGLSDGSVPEHPLRAMKVTLRYDFRAQQLTYHSLLLYWSWPNPICTNDHSRGWGGLFVVLLG